MSKHTHSSHEFTGRTLRDLTDPTTPLFYEGTTHLSAKAANSTIWSISQRFLRSTFGLITTAIIARILFPEDFGLIGMATLTTGIVALFRDYGLGAAIVYKKNVDQIDLSTAFWTNLAVSIVLFLICISISPLAVIFFKNAKVKQIINVLAITFVIESLGSINGTILVKQIRFKEIALSNLFASIVKCVTTIMCVAIWHLGYWGIIYGMILDSVVRTCFNYSFTRWRPFFVFEVQRLNEMLRYGINLFLQRVFRYFSSNIDFFIVGRILGAASLGIYRFSYFVPHKVLAELTGAVSRVLFPVLCLVDDDTRRYERGYLKVIRFISLFSFPAMVGLFCVAGNFIDVVYSARYSDAIIPLQILCFSGMSRSILSTMGSVFNSKGRPDIELKWNLCIFPVTAACVYLGSYYGLSGIAIAMTLTSFLSFFAAWISMRLAKIKFLAYLKALLPAFFGSFFMFLILLPLKHYFFNKYSFTNLTELLLSVVLGVSIYGVYLFLMCLKDIFELIRLIKMGLRNNSAHYISN